MLETERLVLRPWREEDKAPFAAINADPEVMRFFPDIQPREESDASVERVMARIRDHGFGFWAAELKADRRFVGFIGLQKVAGDLPFAPAVEIGWRLDRSVWGQGLAPEGARACLAYGFSALGLGEIVSMTTVANMPSRRVMEKIGMQQDLNGDFDHPHIAKGHLVRPHVLYRIKAA